MKYLPAVALWERFGTRLRMDRKNDLHWLKNLCFVQPLLFCPWKLTSGIYICLNMASAREFRPKKKMKISRNSNAVWKNWLVKKVLLHKQWNAVNGACHTKQLLCLTILQRYQIIFGTPRERIRSLNALVSNAAKDCSLRWRAAVLSKLCSEVKNSHPPSCLCGGCIYLSINLGVTSWVGGKSPSSDFPQALDSILPLSFVHLPIVLSGAGFLSAGEISEVFKVTGSNLTCQYSCPFPVRDSAGDKWGLKGQRTRQLCCDRVYLPLLVRFQCVSAGDKWGF